MPAAQANERISLGYEDVEALVEADRNPKGHDLPLIKALIRRFGFVAPVILDESTGKLTVGHGRRRAVLEMKAAGEDPPRHIRVEGGRWLVPVVRGVAFDSPEAAQEYLLADNRLVELGGWDPKVMAQFTEAEGGGWDSAGLSEVGWDSKAVEALMDAADFGNTKRGSTPEDQKPGFNAGAVKQVVCYFAADKYEAVEARCRRAMQGLKVKTSAELLVALVALYEKAKLKKGGRK